MCYPKTRERIVRRFAYRNYEKGGESGLKYRTHTEAQEPSTLRSSG